MKRRSKRKNRFASKIDSNEVEKLENIIFDKQDQELFLIDDKDNADLRKKSKPDKHL